MDGAASLPPPTPPPTAVPTHRPVVPWEGLLLQIDNPTPPRLQVFSDSLADGAVTNTEADRRVEAALCPQ